MPPKPSQSDIAGLPRRAAARGHDAGQRRHPDPADEARALSDDVDQLLRTESIETRSAEAVERKIALVERIASRACGLRQHYRGPSSKPCRGPIFVSADGTKAAL
ncbi:MAG: hypothetical protein ACRYFW_04110 [Janthinobacterium lividum]